MLWAGRRAPFTLVGGYLGSGKTTLLDHVIRHADGRRLVVLVNDVGAVNVDAALIAEHDGSTIALSNGCVCCSIADDLGRALEQVRSMPEPPDHVVMELSGVAEPARVAPWANTAGFRLDGIVVVADAEQLSDQLDRAFVGDTIRAQLSTADLVVVSKTDLLANGHADVERAIGAITDAPRLVGSRGAVDVRLLLGVDRDGSPPTRGVVDELAYRTWTIAVGEPTIDELRAIVELIDVDVLRAKGLVACRGETSPVEVHVVGARRVIRRRPDLAADRCDQRLVAIGLATTRPDA